MTDATSRLCVGCGTEIVPHSRERNRQKWCSASCMQRERRKDPEFRNKERLRKNEANRREAELRRQTMARRVVVRRRPCGWCGALFEPARSDARYCKDRLCTSQRTHQAAKQRDPDYMRKRNAKQRGTQLRDRVTEFDCAWCGTHNVPGQTCAHQANKFCGKTCKAAWHATGGLDSGQAAAERKRRAARNKLDAAAKGTAGDRTWMSSRCPRCGSATLMHYHALRPGYCSKRCSSADAKDRRRARQAGADITRGQRYKVFEKDDWRCRICGSPVDRTAKVPDYEAPVVDHIVALANGGSHHPDNWQTAHFYCNSVKRDLPMSAVA